MITDNFRALQKSLLLWGGNSNLYGTYYYKNVKGNDRYQSGYTYTPQPWQPATSATGAGIHVGSGTTAPTAGDYALESDLYASVSMAFVSTTRTKGSSGDWSQSTTFSVTNTSDGPINVAEVGYYGSVRGATSEGSTTTSNSDMVTMFDRTLLEHPVTIPSGDSATITYTVQVS